MRKKQEASSTYNTGVKRGLTSERRIRIVRLPSIAVLVALCCILCMPLPAFACGGLFTPGTPLEQNVERIIFAVAPGSMTLYEQINYSGSASDFAWVLPVPSVPTLATASINSFLILDRQTSPTFIPPVPPPCGLQPLGPRTVGSGAPPSGVTVYGSGTVGPYVYDVIGSGDPSALSKWLLGHHYHIPSQVQPAIATYGHGFVTEFAQPSSMLSTGGDLAFTDLQQHYSYVTRLYTGISPEQSH